VANDADTVTWQVVRTDDNGVRTVMARDLAYHEAVVLRDRYDARGHKQFYEVESIHAP
jgi:hypothetical protein